MKFPTILKKDATLVLNKKISTIILILGPLILILLIGLTLQNSSVKNIRASFFSEDPNINPEIIEKIKERGIILIKSQTIEECTKKVKDDETIVCIEMSKKDTEGIETYDLLLHVDFSKQRTVWEIIGRIQQIGEEESEKTKKVLVSGIKTKSEITIQKIDEKEEKIKDSIKKIESIEENFEKFRDEYEIKISELKQEKREIENSIEDLENLQDTLEKDSNLVNIYRKEINQLSNIIFNLRKITNTIEEIESRDKNDLNSIEKELDQTKRELKTTNQELSQIKDDLKKLRNLDFDKITKPVNVRYQSVLTEESGEIKKPLQLLDYLFPTFLILFITFNSIIFAATKRFNERKSPAFVRNMASKAKNFTFANSNLITATTIIFIQALVILFTITPFLSLNVSMNIFSLLSITLFAVFFFSTIGILIGSFSSSSESTITLSISIPLLFFILSPTITPLETLPNTIGKILSYFPFALMENKIRMISIFNTPLIFSISELIILTTLLIFLFIGIKFACNKTKEKEI